MATNFYHWILFAITVIHNIHKCCGMTNYEFEDFNNFLLQPSVVGSPSKGSDGDLDEADDDIPPSLHAWEQSGQFEGDMILNDQQLEQIVNAVPDGVSRNGVKDHTRRWPNNELIYYIHKDHFNPEQVKAIEDGIEDIRSQSCIKFRPYKKGDKHAVVIIGKRRGCFSEVGHQRRFQVLNLSQRHPVGKGCFRHGTVVHELLHALGFYHMQSSPDRDKYIDIIWQNIIQEAKSNFRKYSRVFVTDFGVGYDYGSVLHYSPLAFSRNGEPTILPKEDGAIIGQRNGMSGKDIQKLRIMYCHPPKEDSGFVNSFSKFLDDAPGENAKDKANSDIKETDNFFKQI